MPFTSLQRKISKKISVKHFFNENNNSNIVLLTEFLEPKEIKRIKNYFNYFFKELLSVAFDEESKIELKRKKTILRTIYYSYVTKSLIFNPLRFIGDNEDKLDLLKDKSLQASLVSEVLIELSFLSDIIFAFVFNNRKKYNAILKRFSEMTGKKLVQNKKEILIKIINKRNELKKVESSSHRFSWKVAISSIYNKLDTYDKKALLQINTDPPQTLNSAQIKSIAQTIAYHQKQGNLPK